MKVQPLKSLASLPEDLDSIPKTCVLVHNCNFILRGSGTLFWLLQKMNECSTSSQTYHELKFPKTYLERKEREGEREKRGGEGHANQ